MVTLQCHEPLIIYLVQHDAYLSFVNSRLSVIGFVLGAGHDGTLCLSKLQDKMGFRTNSLVSKLSHITVNNLCTAYKYKCPCRTMVNHVVTTDRRWTRVTTNPFPEQKYIVSVTNDIGFNSSRFVYKEKTYRRELDQY